jgi:glutamine amidotransferase
MQLLFESGEEGTSGVRPGIGLLQGTVQNLRKLGVHTRYVPNIGWSSGSTETGLENSQIELFWNKDLYFYCHEYGILASECRTIEIKHVLELPGDKQPARILSGFVSKNLTGVQFHPEKSGITGERFLRTWVMSKESKKANSNPNVDFN